jgi:hypothetical protein
MADNKESKNDWVECRDNDGHVYYYNTHTEEVTWDKPSVFSDGDAVQSVEESGLDVSDLKAHIAAAFEKFSSLLSPPKPQADKEETLAKVEAAKAAHASLEAEREAAVAAGGERWVEVYDPQSHAYYYHGTYSNEVTWDKPEDYVMAADDELMTAAIRIQCAWRSRSARVKTHAQEEVVQHEWVACSDAESGHVYYYNTHTEEVTWEKPGVFHDGDAVQSVEESASGH